MTLPWQPYREPFCTTLLRTGTIALIVGAVLVVRWGGPRRWPLATLLVLWPSFGGHWVDLWFLNWLRPCLSPARVVQVVTRLGVWFVGGACLGIGVALTGMLLAGFRLARWPAWWVGGVAFIGVELVAHLFLQLRGRPSFYNGRG